MARGKDETMEAIEFRLNGQQLRLTRQTVIDSVADQTPQSVNTWAVKVGGRLFPVKQVFARATGTNRTDFISHRARDVLRRLGFEVIDAGRGDASSVPPNGNGSSAGSTHQDRRSMNTRLAALTAAVQFAATRPETQLDDVLRAADAFEAWLAS